MSNSNGSLVYQIAVLDIGLIYNNKAIIFLFKAKLIPPGKFLIKNNVILIVIDTYDKNTQLPPTDRERRKEGNEREVVGEGSVYFYFVAVVYKWSLPYNYKGIGSYIVHVLVPQWHPEAHNNYVNT